MSDIKSVIALLCKHLSLSIGCTLKPEYFRLAKYNKGDDEVVQALWTILHTLSQQAVREENIRIDFDRFDDVYATKLLFTLLQYPTFDFYGLSKKNSSCSRELLLAFGWLLASKHVLNVVVREKIAGSILGHEYSCTEESMVSLDQSTRSNPNGDQDETEIDGAIDDPETRMHRITHTCGRISHNIKAIAELSQEKAKLTTKIHAATLNTSGLPHLSVFETVLAKKLCVKNKQHFTKKDQEHLRQLNALAEVLEVHNQWCKLEHVFNDWMVTVVEESKKEKAMTDDRCEELSKFLTLLRHVTKKELHLVKSNEATENSLYGEACVSRFLRTSEEGSEVESWISERIERLKVLEEEVGVKVKCLRSELRKMLKSIPNCVEI